MLLIESNKSLARTTELNNEKMLASNTHITQTVQNLTATVEKLMEAVNELITDKKVREAQDEARKESDDRVTAFIEDNTERLKRLKRGYGIYDKAIIPIISVFVLGVLALLGFELKK